MTTNNLNKFAIIGTFTIASIAQPLASSDMNDLENNYILNNPTHSQKLNYDFDTTNTDLVWEENDRESLENFNTLTEFVSKLVKNSKQLDKEFVDAINKGYWNLL